MQLIDYRKLKYMLFHFFHFPFMVLESNLVLLADFCISRQVEPGVIDFYFFFLASAPLCIFFHIFQVIFQA